MSYFEPIKKIRMQPELLFPEPEPNEAHFAQ